jgi:hypothetical protein
MGARLLDGIVSIYFLQAMYMHIETQQTFEKIPSQRKCQSDFNEPIIN